MPGSKKKDRKGVYVGFFLYCDLFSRKAFFYLAKSASGSEMKKSFKILFRSKGNVSKMTTLRSDYGQQQFEHLYAEVYTSQTQNIFRK